MYIFACVRVIGIILNNIVLNCYIIISFDK